MLSLFVSFYLISRNIFGGERGSHPWEEHTEVSFSSYVVTLTGSLITVLVCHSELARLRSDASGFLRQRFSGLLSIHQLFLFCLGIQIYLPFEKVLWLRIWNSETLKSEVKTEPARSSRGSDFHLNGGWFCPLCFTLEREAGGWEPNHDRLWHERLFMVNTEEDCG